MLIPIVDENDNIIDYKERDLIGKNDIYRVSALWITNSKGEVLLAQRHRTKSHDPLKWGPAVAGTVEKDESYIENIIKEAEEELGLKDIKPQQGPKLRMKGNYNFFVQWFYLTIDKDISEFIIQENEVEKVKWFSVEELKRLINQNSEIFIPSFRDYIDVLL